MSIEATQEQRPELYLIAHKVRGEPAFDIAHRLQIGDEEGWIIPTSGHRAYPYWAKLIIDLIPNGVFQNGIEGLPVSTYAHFNDYLFPEPPPNWPDHYTTTAAPRVRLADALGFTKPKPTTPIRRI